MSNEAETLTAAMSAGDARAVELFYRRYFDLLYAHAARVCGRDESFCLDVVQESMLRIIRSVRPVQSERQLMAWLKLVVKTAAYDLLRGESRRRHREMLVAVGETATEAPEDDAAHEDRLAWLADRIRCMDPKIVRMIELRYQKRWTLSRIAESLGLSVGTVDGRLRRALRDLRRSAMEQNHD